MTRRPIIAGNWKMHNLVNDSISLVEEIMNKLSDEDINDLPTVIVAPVYTSLFSVNETINKCGCGKVKLSAQNCYYEEKGAFTGEESTQMLKDVGCEYIIIGHSERRGYFNETDELINKKAKAILNNGLIPIICCGESLEQRENNETDTHIASQIKAALYDYQFEKEDQEKINCIEKKYQNLDNLSLFEELKKIDPESCKILHPNNRRRVLRALVIYNLHGQSKSNLIEKQAHKPLYNCKFIGLYLPKDQLNQRINTRVEKMFDNGIIEEVKKLNGLSSTASKAIGVNEIKNYLNNKINLNECKELIKLHTRQYSKRQMTWLKHQFNVKWFEISDNTLIEIYNYLKGEDFLCGKK